MPRFDLQVTSSSSSPRTSPPIAPPGFLAVLLVPYIVGIILASTTKFLPGSLLLGLAMGGVLLFVTFYTRRSGLFALIAVLCVLFLGAFRFQMAKQPASNSIQRVPTPIYAGVTGHITSFDTRKRTMPGGSHVSWSTAQLRVHEVTVGDRTFSVQGTVSVYSFRFVPEYRRGDRIHVSGRLRRHSPPGNPGTVSLEWWKAQQELGGSMVVDDRHDWSAPASGERCWAGMYHGIRQWLYERLNASAYRFQLLPALLLGIRSSISQTSRAYFQTSGSIHFLAVSGLHVGFIVLFFFFLFRMVGCSLRGTSLLIILLLPVYVALTGFRTATVRAAVMAGVFLGGILIGRETHPLQLLVLAAWSILLLHPLDLFSAGFQFSFLAVLSLTLFSGLIRKLLPNMSDNSQRLIIEPPIWTWMKSMAGKVGGYLRLVTFATFLVLLGITPLNVFHFHLASMGGFLLNPPFFLLIPLVLILGGMFLVVSITHALIPVSGFSVVLSCLGAILKVLEQVILRSTIWVSSIEWLHLYLPAPPLVCVLLFWLVLIGSVIWVRSCSESTPFRTRLYFFCLTVLCTLTIASGWLLSRFPGREFSSVTMLDVGHGLSTMVSDGRGQTLVYDSGSSGFSDPGRGTTASALWHQGIRRIDVLILSHGDLDHISGVRSLIKRFDIGVVLVSSHFRETEAGKTIIDLLYRSEIPVKTARKTDYYRFGAMKVAVYPAEGTLTSDKTQSNRNPFSLVARVKLHGKQILLTGDLEKGGKQKFASSVARRLHLRQPDILQVPHHGGAGSASDPLTSVVSPAWALISAGRGRVANTVRTSYRKAGAHVLSTAGKGAVKLRWTDGRSTINAFRWRNGWKEIRK